MKRKTINFGLFLVTLAIAALTLSGCFATQGSGRTADTPGKETPEDRDKTPGDINEDKE